MTSCPGKGAKYAGPVPVAAEGTTAAIIDILHNCTTCDGGGGTGSTCCTQIPRMYPPGTLGASRLVAVILWTYTTSGHDQSLLAALHWLRAEVHGRNLL